MITISDKFPRYTQFSPLVPVWCVTPGVGGCIHRFFDTSPVSPSGRYMALFRLPQEKRNPVPGEAGEIVLIDLREGVERVIGTSRGWEPQLGANINWGVSDSELYYNDVDIATWEPFAVKRNPLTGEVARMEGTVYRVSPDGRHLISACMKRMRRTQPGYGVVVPEADAPHNHGLPGDDGLYITDTQTGKRRLLVSIRQVMEQARPCVPKEACEGLELYGFHCKYNTQGSRIMYSIRGVPKEPGEYHIWVVTMLPDGSDIHVAAGPEQWFKGGHHTTWQPDGEMLSMNLCIDGDDKLWLVQVRYDGTGLVKMHTAIPGSGHPTLHPNGRQMLTDAYEHEPVAFGDGTVPLRLIDLRAGTEQCAVRVNVANEPGTKENRAFRVDPHPAWAPDNRHVVFNGYVGGTRRVFIADFGELLRG